MQTNTCKTRMYVHGEIQTSVRSTKWVGPIIPIGHIDQSDLREGTSLCTWHHSGRSLHLALVCINQMQCQCTSRAIKRNTYTLCFSKGYILIHTG
uniref:DUF5641 domain-containing protein n=1 Tax=Heterorhabditis bacteriophora TaxID=37862 RepID=A0A1I7XFU6_HETBA